MRRRARVASLWAALLLAALLLPTRARAHGALRAAVPRSGARLATAPRDLRLTFTEAVELAVARLTLTAAGGRPVPLSPLRRGASATVVVADVVEAAALLPGVYTVGWQVVGHDGHPVRGSYRFTILPAAVAAADPARAVVAHDSATRDTTAHATAAHAPAAHDSAAHPAPAAAAFGVESPLYAAARWLGLLGLVGLVGAAAFALVVLPAAVRHALPADVAAAAAERARPLGIASAGVLGVASLLRLAAQSAAVNGPAHALDGAAIAPILTGTSWGLGWALQLGAALVALVAFASRRAPRAWLAAACAATAAVGAALSGHAAAVEGRAALAVAADALHVLAAGGWVGSLLLLAAAGLPATSGATRATGATGARVASVAALVRAFSPWALACAALAAATGATSAWLHLGAPAALWSTTYGRTLLVKLALLLPAAAAGAYNWRRARPALAAGTDATPGLARAMTVELLAAVAVLAVTAVLVATPP